MAELALTKRLDTLRLEVEAMLQAPKQPPKARAALTEILQLLGEAADTAEEARL